MRGGGGRWPRIVGEGVAAMRREYGSRPEDLVAAVGPSIGACCYAVGEEVRSQFRERFGYADELFQERGDSGLYVDLWEANRRQLLDAGVEEARIAVVGECTACAREADGSGGTSRIGLRRVGGADVECGGDNMKYGPVLVNRELFEKRDQMTPVVWFGDVKFHVVARDEGVGIG